jgi:Tfp pilus assembly protein PilZ
MGDKRRYKRFTVEVMDISGKMALANDVKVLDISIGGVSIRADRRLNIGTDYVLRLENKGVSLKLRGTVVWASLSGSAPDKSGNVIPIYTAGMQIMDNSYETMQGIARFIDESKKDIEEPVDLYKMSGLRLYARVPLGDVDKAVLNSMETYSVKILSLGGMLIESGQAMEAEAVLPMEIMFAPDRSITVKSRIVSCLPRRAADAELYNIGVEFIELEDKDRELLEEFLSHIEKGNAALPSAL